MKRENKKHLLHAIYGLIALILIIILAKFETQARCGCYPAEEYRAYPFIFTLYEDLTGEICSAVSGCVTSYWVAPIDLIIILVLLWMFYSCGKK